MHTRKLSDFQKMLKIAKFQISDEAKKPIESLRLDKFKEIRKFIEYQIEIESKIGRPQKPHHKLPPFMATYSRKLSDFNVIMQYYKDHMERAENSNGDIPQTTIYEPSTIRLISATAKSEFEYMAHTSKQTILDEQIDFSQPNKDIPDQKHGWEQGWLEERKNPELDFRGLDDRDFRERCVVYGNPKRLYVLCQKSKIDFQLPTHLRPDWIAEKMPCHDEVATRLSMVFQRLNFDKKSCFRFIFKKEVNIFEGELVKKEVETPKILGKKSKGIQKVYWNPEQINENKQVTKLGEKEFAVCGKVCFIKPVYLAEYLENLADEMDEVTVQWSNCINSAYVEKEYLAEYGITSPSLDLFWAGNLDDNDDSFQDFEDLNPEFSSDPFIDDDLEVNSNSDNPFKAWPLFSGNEAMSHEFLTMLRFASQERLDSIAKELPKWKKGVRQNYHKAYGDFGQIYWKQYKYWYLTDSQISQIWIYIKDRRKQLVENVKFSKDAEIILECMERNSNKKLGAAMINAWKEGVPFNSFGILFEWNDKPTPNELQALWNVYYSTK